MKRGRGFFFSTGIYRFTDEDHNISTSGHSPEHSAKDVSMAPFLSLTHIQKHTHKRRHIYKQQLTLPARRDAFNVSLSPLNTIKKKASRRPHLNIQYDTRI